MQKNAFSSAEKEVDVALRERDLAFLFEETRKVGRIESFPHTLRIWNARKYFWLWEKGADRGLQGIYNSFSKGGRKVNGICKEKGRV